MSIYGHKFDTLFWKWLVLWLQCCQHLWMKSVELIRAVYCFECVCVFCMKRDEEVLICILLLLLYHALEKKMLVFLSFTAFSSTVAGVENFPWRNPKMLRGTPTCLRVVVLYISIMQMSDTQRSNGHVQC